MKINIKTLGCRLNQAESDNIAEDLRGFGVDVLYSGKDADLYIINTCCITHTAVKKSRQEIHKIRNRNKEAKILVCGCARELKKEADIFVKDKNEIPNVIAKKYLKIKKIIKNSANNLLKENNSRIRAFIKIQDGCNNCCTYCIIPHIRGKSKSLTPESIIDDIKRKEEVGFKEIVLTGVSIGQYQSDKLNLTELVKIILNDTKVPRIRFSSINPESINNDFILLFKNKRICRHLHLSLQSGSDTVLSRMGRKYNTKDYLSIVKNIYKKYPDFNFTTDIIVGFPGETEKEFKETCVFVKKVGFSKIHIFRYSKREGTRAFLMQNSTDEKVKQNRATKLEVINQSLKRSFCNNMLDKKHEILFENKKGNTWQGFTNNYIRVKYENDLDLKNIIKRVIILNNNLIL